MDYIFSYSTIWHATSYFRDLICYKLVNFRVCEKGSKRRYKTLYCSTPLLTHISRKHTRGPSDLYHKKYG